MEKLQNKQIVHKFYRSTTQGRMGFIPLETLMRLCGGRTMVLSQLEQ